MRSKGGTTCLAPCTKFNAHCIQKIIYIACDKSSVSPLHRSRADARFTATYFDPLISWIFYEYFLKSQILLAYFKIIFVAIVEWQLDLDNATALLPKAFKVCLIRICYQLSLIILKESLHSCIERLMPRSKESKDDSDSNSSGPDDSC